MSAAGASDPVTPLGSTMRTPTAEAANHDITAAVHGRLTSFQPAGMRK